MKDWRTTVAGVVAAGLVMLGIFYPEKLDPATQGVINSAVGEIISGAGALIAVIGGLFAKDPKDETEG